MTIVPGFKIRFGRWRPPFFLLNELLKCLRNGIKRER